MKFRESAIPGVFAIEIEPHTDERGFFARLYCPEEFRRAGIDFTPVQSSVSRNNRRHTLRGMHFQNAPHDEAKLVQVTRGAVFDVVIDLRPESPAFKRWIGFSLDAKSANAVYIPRGCAHGFLTLEADTDVHYHIDRMFAPGHAKGYRWNDPAFGIEWPSQPDHLSGADTNWPDFAR